MEMGPGASISTSLTPRCDVDELQKSGPDFRGSFGPGSLEKRVTRSGREIATPGGGGRRERLGWAQRRVARSSPVLAGLRGSSESPRRLREIDPRFRGMGGGTVGDGGRSRRAGDT